MRCVSDVAVVQRIHAFSIPTGYGLLSKLADRLTESHDVDSSNHNIIGRPVQIRSG